MKIMISVIVLFVQLNAVAKPDQVVPVKNNDSLTSWYGANKSAYENYAMRRYVNSVKYTDELKTENRLCYTKIAADSSSHDGTIQIDADGKIYIVSCVNQTEKHGDNPSMADTVTRLDIFDSRNNYSRTSYDLFKVGDKYGKYTLTRGSGAPNCMLVGNILYIFTTTAYGTSDNWVVMSCKFNIDTLEFSEHDVFKLIYNSETFECNLTNIKSRFGDDAKTGMKACNCFAFNATLTGDGKGNYYGVLANYRYLKGLILKTRDFVTWEVLNTCSDLDTKTEFEVASMYDDGYLYLAFRQIHEMNIDGQNVGAGKTKGNVGHAKMLLVKYDLKNDRWFDQAWIPNCASRPAFFRTDDGKIYLFNNAYSRYMHDIVEIEPSSLNLSQVIQQAHQYSPSNYMSIAQYKNDFYYAVTQDGISVYKFLINSVSQNKVDNVIRKLFELK